MTGSILGVFASGLLFLSFAGWGALVHRVLSKSYNDFGLQTATGLAFLCLFGGVLSCFGFAVQAVCATIVAGGALFFIIHLTLQRERLQLFIRGFLARVRNPVSLLAVVVLVSIAAILLFGAAYQLFNGHDDNQAYAVFPVKMIQTGSIGVDPFNERRLVSSLGGQSFLHALFLSVGTFTSLNCVDLATGRLVFLSLLIGHLYAARIVFIWGILIVIVALFVPVQAVNTSSAITGLALFYGLFRILFQRSEGAFRDILITSLFVAALSSLKHSFIPVAILTTTAITLIGKDHAVRGKLRHLAMILSLALLLLLPWMIESYRSSGTFLFRIFGKGHHGSVYGTAPDVAASWSEMANLSVTASKVLELIRSPEFAPSLSLFIFLLWSWRRGKKVQGSRRADGLSTAPMILLIVVWAAAFCFAPVAGIARRYTYPFTCAALFFVFIEQFYQRSDWTPGFRRAQIRPLILFFLLVVFYVPPGLLQLRSTIESTLQNRNKEVNGLRRIREIRRLQATVPAGERILAVLSQPAVLDFDRNTIFVVDHAASVSPPPGLPIHGSASEVASYLRQQNVRYILYGYGDEATFGRKAYEYRLSLRGSFYTDRVRRLAENNIRFRDHIVEMSRRFRIAADNGREYVIDLSE